MKKCIFVLIFFTFFTEVFCQTNYFLFESKQKTISDFPEEIEVRDRLNQLRNYSNYTYPKNFKLKSKVFRNV